MFRIIFLLGLIAITLAIVWAVRSQLIQLAGTKQTLRQQSIDIANNLRQWRSLPAPALVGTLMRFFYLATLASVVLLALTGFLPVIILGEAVSNLALILHLLLAPFFAIGITALALFWAERHSFNNNDLERLRTGHREEESNGSQYDPNVWQKFCFWLSVLLAVPLIGSTILMMYPFYGTSGQEWLLHVHGYTGLMMLAVVVLHTYLVLASKGD